MAETILYIGMGGMGVNTVKKIYELNQKSGYDHSNAFYLGIDFETTDLNHFPTENNRAFKVKIGIRNSRYFIDSWYTKNIDDFKNWWPQVSDGSPYLPAKDPDGGSAGGQVRAKGALANYYKFTTDVVPAIDTIIGLMEDHSVVGFGAGQTITKNIFFINSLSGGTGAGIFTDIISYVRSHQHIDYNDRLFSVLYDPTLVSYLLNNKNDSNMGMAALVEADYWMSNPQHYHKSYANHSLVVDLQNQKKWCDGVFLIQSHTKSGKIFNGEIYEKYTDTVAQYLYISNLSRDIFEKLKANTLNRFDSLENYNGSSLKYSSLGITEIKVPQKQITDYMVSASILRTGISSFISGGPGITSLPEDILSNIPLAGDKKLGSSKLKLPISFGIIESSQDISGIYVSQDIYVKHIDNKAQGRLNKVLSEIELHEAKTKSSSPDLDIDQSHDLYDKYSDQVLSVTDILENSIKSKIESCFTSALKDLMIDDLYEWLDVIYQKIREEKEKLFISDFEQVNNKESLSSQIKNRNDKLHELVRELNRPAEKSKIFGKVKKSYFSTFSDTKQEVKEAFISWHKLVIFRIHTNAISNLYDKVLDYLTSKINSASAYQDAISNVENYYKNKYNSFVKGGDFGRQIFCRGSILNKARADQNEYSLSLQLDIPVEKIRADLEEINSQLENDSRLQKDINIEGGITQFYNSDEKVDQEKIEDHLHEIVSDKITPVVYNEILKRYKIDDILDTYVDDRKHKIIDCKDNKVKLADLKKEYSLEFGEENLDNLFNKDFYQPDLSTVTNAKERESKKNAWNGIAKTAIITKFASIASSFWNTPEHIRQEISREANIPMVIQHELKNMLVADKSRYEILNLPDMVNLLNLPEDMTDRIVFLAQDCGAPLYCAQQSQKFNVLFQKYQEYKGQQNVLPPHIDQQFMKLNWDFTQEPSGDKNAMWLYLLGLGTGVLSHKGKNYYVDNLKKPIANSHPKLMEVLELGQSEAIELLKDSIRHKIQSAYHQNRENLKTVHDIFVNGCEYHINKINKLVQLSDQDWHDIVTSDLNIKYKMIVEDGSIIIENYGIIPENKTEYDRLVKYLTN